MKNKLTEAVKRLLKWAGLDIGVEFDKGDIRFPDTHKVEMRCSYGHIRSHLGSDGMALDCYIGDSLDCQEIYAVQQLDSEGEFDELKIMIGFENIGKAKQAYLDHMPREFFGGIVQTSLGKLKQYKRNNPNRTENRIIERAANGLPLVVEVESLYPFISANGRDWPLEGLTKCVANTSRALEQGAIMPNLKSHPEDDFVRIITLENGAQVREYVPSSNEEISKSLSIWIDPSTNNLVSRARFDHSKEEGLKWAKLADQGKELPISIRVEAHCTLPQGQGHCYPYDDALLFWDWLVPGLEQPGIKGSGFTKIIEAKIIEVDKFTHIQKPNHCCNNCAKGEVCCSKKTLNKSTTQLINPKFKSESRDRSGSAKKEQNKMEFAKFIAALQALIDQGLDDSTLKTFSMAWLNGGASADPPEVEPTGEPEASNPYEQALEFFNKMKKEAKQAKAKVEGFAGDAATRGTLLKAEPIDFNKVAEGFFGVTAQEAKELGNQFRLEKQAKSVRASLETEINNSRTTKALFESHDVSNTELYPLAKVQVAIEDIARSNQNLDVAKERLAVRLEKIAFDSAKTISEAEAKRKAEADKAAANNIYSSSYTPATVGISQRFLEQSAKVEKMIADIFKKYAPSVYAEYERSKKDYAAHIQGHVANLHRATESTYKRRLSESATFVADRKLEATTINNTHMLNLPVFIDGAMEFMYWASPVMRLVSSLPSDAINVGQPVRIAGSNKFAQFVQVKTRVRDQRRRFDPRRKITSSAPTRTMTLNEGYQQFLATRDTSSIRLDRALVDYLNAAPMFENVPKVLIMHLVAEMMMWRQLKVTMELVMSAHRYKLLTISNETTQDVSGERVTSSTEGVTLGGITFPNAKTAVWMRRGINSGGTVTYGPVMQPRNKPAINVFGVVSESPEYPITLTVAGNTITPAQLDEDNNIVAINEGDDVTSAFAFHPKGILVCRENYGAQITAGTFVISQYSKVRNYHAMSVDKGATARSDFGDQKLEELLIVRSDVATKRQAAKPDYCFMPEAIFDKTIALSGRAQNMNQIDGLDFAKISADYGRDVMHSGGNIRGAEILTTNEPYLGQDNLIGVMGLKGATVCQELSVPVIDGPHAIQATDENGLGSVTDEDSYRLSETTFIQTIRPLDPTTGEYSEYPITSLYFEDTVESSDIIA